MRTSLVRTILAAAIVAGGLGAARWASAQTNLQRLDEGIRGQGGQGPDIAAPSNPLLPPALPPGKAPARARAYLGAVVDDQNDRGRGVRVLMVRPGGPADRAGLRAQDLIVGTAGARVRQLSELAAIIEASSPGDHLAMEILRGGLPQKLDVTLGPPPPSGAAEMRPEAIPPPAAEQPPVAGGAPGAAGSAGPSLSMSVPLRTVAPPSIPPPPLPGLSGPPVSDSARIEQLQRRVDELERRVQEMERALAEGRKDRGP